jgi:hypothetical protein
MKPGDLVKISPRPFLERRETIGMILEWDNNDPIHLIPAKVAVQGKITYVGKEYISQLKNNTHASKNKN